MADTYCFLHLHGGSRSAAQMVEDIHRDALPAWRARDIVPWGLWTGLFGVASNELIVMAAAAADVPLAAFTEVASQTADVQRAVRLEPTIRPEQQSPRTRAGLYVFRFFRVAPADVEEFVTLSGQAWATFEGADSYAAEPQGLFRQKDRGEPLQDMLLVTWYDGLQSWQTSRQPAADAADRFRRRRELTRSTVALATRLVV